MTDANARRQSKVDPRQARQRAGQAADGRRAGDDGRRRSRQPKADDDAALKAAAEAVPDPGRQIYLDEAKLRTEAALAANIGFTERLVWFWSNHFCISADKIRSMSGAYEREAIRPHVLGRFADMLLAVEGHPAMLFFLDNLGSMGANSIAGINRSRGLNENLARETLELHTLGVRTGYTQDDVIGFANAYTGWTLVPPGDNPEHGGEFSFNPRLHEPGAQKVLGKLYEDEAVGQARAVLAISRSIPPRRRISPRKLAAISSPTRRRPRWSSAWRNRSSTVRGDLKEVAKTMVLSDEAWSGRRPSSSARANGWSAWCAPPASRRSTRRDTPADRPCSASPCGGRHRQKAFPTTKRAGSTAWAAGSTSPTILPSAWPAGSIPTRSSAACWPPRVSPEVSEAVGRAETRQQALALLFMSADFQRR